MEHVKSIRAKRQLHQEENEGLGPTNHLPRAAKTAFCISAECLNPEWREMLCGVPKHQFMAKVLLMTLQDNGTYSYLYLYPSFAY